jgi:hypothetical protein
MSMAQIAGKTAFLPMEAYEVEKFLYDLGLDGPGAEHRFEFLGGFCDGYRIDWGIDFRLAARLAQQVSDMGEMRDALKAWCCAQEHCTAADALRASYNLNTFTFLPGIGSDEILGDFALENELIEEYNALPDNIYEALDKEKAGAKMREMEGGMFVNEGYLVLGEDFSGEPIPEDKPAFFQLRFSDGNRDSGWCDVPLSEADERLIARVFDSEDIAGLPMECRSIIPQLNGIISGTDELPELRFLDEALVGRSGEEIQKYKVLLEAARPESVGMAFRLAETLDRYDIALEYADPAAYGWQCVEDNCNFNGYDSLRDFIDYAGFGAAMLHDDGYMATRYGAVYMNIMAQSILAGPNTASCGAYYCGRTEGYPTFVCWDPDAQNVWLELGEHCLYSAPAGDFSYYQQICEDWGLRHCASQEDYEQIISGLGAQPYDEVMAEDQEQGFGGMGGMS